MNLKSLGYRTDLIFTGLDGEAIDRGTYLVVKTLSNPEYFWGNLLIFEKAPAAGDCEKWKSLFRNEFHDPRVEHMTFAWDSEEVGEIDEFISDGFSLEKAFVLTAKQGDIRLPEKNNSFVLISSPKNESDWEAAIQVQISTGSDVISRAKWESFYRSQMKRYRELIARNQGQWFSAYWNDQVVGGLGIFHDGKIGRFQIVSVHPEFQRQGICGTLVYQASQFAFEKMKIETLVMVADEEYHAARIYESVGFKKAERTLGVCKAKSVS